MDDENELQIGGSEGKPACRSWLCDAIPVTVVLAFLESEQ